jgi:hypothetical protein
MVADAVARARQPWWIIGSAAVALHGRDLSDIGDVDLLMSEEDAGRLIASLQLPAVQGRPDPLFRSTLFATWEEPPLPVEIMAGFSLATVAGWREVRLETRQAAIVNDRTIYIPEARELAALLRNFGRPKDLERARLLAD